MSKRIQVLLEEREFEELRQAASSEGVPVSECVSDIDEMLAEIEKEAREPN